MKKNFLKVAALLIVAMLMVVSCSQEVAPKTEDNGLVEATIGLGRSSRDVKVDAPNGAKISYYYTLEPTWTAVNNGSPIYGAVSTEALLVNNKTIADEVESTSLGLVTPGLWKITVFGYIGTGNSKQLVLKGEKKAYFINGSNNATVFVAPVSNSNATGSVNIDLEMQNLGSTENNVISYSIVNLDGGSEVKDSIKGNISNTTNKGSYVVTVKGVRTGFNTITLSVPSAVGKGGITKTFLMIPTAVTNDVEVTISGSVYPSDFQESSITVKVLKVNDGTISVKNGDAPVPPKTVDEVEGVYVLDGSKSYTFKYTDGDFVIPNGATASQVTYKWNLGSVQKGIGAEISSTALDLNSANGDYSITCVATYTYTLDGTPYTVEASQTLGKVRVVTPSTTD